MIDVPIGAHAPAVIPSLEAQLELEYYVLDPTDGLSDLGLDEVDDGSANDASADDHADATRVDNIVDATPATLGTDPTEAHDCRPGEDPNAGQEQREIASDLPPEIHPEAFWDEVVRAQQAFAVDPQHLGPTLEAAVVWAANMMSQQAAARAFGNARDIHPTKVGASAVLSDPRHAARTLEQQATAALVVAWEQRDSALYASGGARG